MTSWHLAISRRYIMPKAGAQMFRSLVKSATLLLRREARLVLVCAAFLAWLAVGTAQAGSLIAFPNVNENVQPSLLPGYLAKPDGSGPFPAVVILHGCSGFFSSYASVADDLRWEGYVALA